MRRPRTTLFAAVTLVATACSSPETGNAPALPAGDSGTFDVPDAGARDAPLPDAATDPIDDAATKDRDAPAEAGDAESDAGVACAWGGAPGLCLTVSACAALSDHTSYAGTCPGPASIACCIKTPSTADNPPVPAGYHLMLQSQVTPDMTAWAVSILNDPATYPMFATAMKSFGALDVLARVEWHPPDFQNGAVHRGVTLYVP